MSARTKIPTKVPVHYMASDRHDEGPLVYSIDRPPAERCGRCGGAGVIAKGPVNRLKVRPCKQCLGIGFTGIDPHVDTTCMPSSNGKGAVLAARMRQILSNGHVPREDIVLYRPGDASDPEDVYHSRAA